MSHAVLRIQCPDAKGIVYRLSEFIYQAKGNILDSHQHQEANYFFIWVKIDLKDLSLARSEFEAQFTKIADHFKMQWKITYSDQRKRLGLLVSKHDHCLYDLILRKHYGEWDADIALIISNHPDLKKVGDHFGIPYFHVPMPKGDKAPGEQAMLKILDQHKVELVVLARYMQILSGDFVAHYKDKIINVHHSFLPAFIGANPYHQAYQKGVKTIGATAHYVTEDLDMGPIIEQQTARVHHGTTPTQMIELGRDNEKRVLAAAVQAHLEDRIMVHQGRTIVFPR